MKKTTYEYIRVGINYYKLVYKPLLSKDEILIYLKWNFSSLVRDKVSIEKIKYYHDFIIYPEHIHYKQDINGFFNKYSPMEYKPEKGDCNKILNFLNHVFGEQFELGLDYLKIIYEKPTQTLPILCLVSEARNTGKTTFLNFLKMIFGANMTINTNEDFRSQFNSGWSNCVLIGVDETFLDKKEDSERIKNLSTAKTYKEESKGVDKREIEFFGKFILCSNHTRTFIKIDKLETRYWIREIPKLTVENKDLLIEMKREIPHFLQFLVERSYSTPRQSRMWFTPDQIRTDALDKVKLSNRSKLELELISILNIIMETNNKHEVQFTLKDATDWLQYFNIKLSGLHQLKQIIQESWGIKPYDNCSTYILYRFNKEGVPVEFKAKGRFYSYSMNINPE